LIGVLAQKTSIDNYQPFTLIAEIDLNRVGYFIVASFVGAWLLSVLIWKTGKYEAIYSSGIKETEHEHKEFKL
jgi:high-affinity nickel-transport protein